MTKLGLIGLPAASLLSGAIAHTASLTDALAVTDARAQVHTVVRSQIDPLGLIDSMAGSRLLVVSILDGIGMPSSTGGAQGASYTRLDSEVLGDAIAKLSAHARVILDAMGLDDAVVYGTSSPPPPFLDALGITDSVVATFIHLRDLTEALGMIDARARIFAPERTYTELQQLTDTLSRIAPAVRALADALGFSDSLSSQTGKAITDGASLTDSASALLLVTRQFNHVVGLIDSVTAQIATALQPIIIETFFLADRPLIAAKSSVLALLESCGIKDRIYRQFTGPDVLEVTSGITQVVEIGLER